MYKYSKKCVTSIFSITTELKLNFKFLIKDVCETFNFKDHIDLIIHAAGIASPYYYRKKPIETLDVAIKGTRNSLDLAKKHNSKGIFFSSSEIYGDPDPKQIPIKENYRGNISSMGPRACYDESKRIGETLCYIYNNSFDVHTNIIRPFNVYGPGMNQKDYRVLPNFISNIVKNLKNQKQMTGFDDILFTPLEVSNLSEMISEIAKTDYCGIIHLSSDTSISKFQFILQVADIFELDKSLIQKGTSEEVKFVAKRPKNLTLSNNKAKKILRTRIVPLKESLEKLRMDL